MSTHRGKPVPAALSVRVLGVLAQTNVGKDILVHLLHTRQAHHEGRPADYVQGTMDAAPHWRALRGLPQPIVLVDCPLLESHLSETVRAAAAMDGVILCVRLETGITARLREVILLLRQAGVRQLLIFLVTDTDDPRHIDAAELAIRQALVQWEYPGDDIPIFQGNPWAVAAVQSNPAHPAWKPIDQLLEAIDQYIFHTRYDQDAPLSMPLGRTFQASQAEYGSSSIQIINIGLGRIDQGYLAVGDRVEAVGGSQPSRLFRIEEISCFRQPATWASAGAAVRVVLSPQQVKFNQWHGQQIGPGTILAEPDTVQAAQRLTVKLTLLASETGHRRRPIQWGFRPYFLMHTARQRGSLILPEGVRQLLPGETYEIDVVFGDVWLAAQPGQLFSCRNGNDTIGYGQVLHLHS